MKTYLLLPVHTRAGGDTYTTATPMIEFWKGNFLV
jgi:hypothetical protein